MIRNRYSYPTPPIRDIKGKETQTRNNWALMETSLAESQTDSYFPTKWPNGYPKQTDVSNTHIQRQTIIKKTKPTKMWHNTCFKAIFSVCFGTLIIIWGNSGHRKKLIIFYISLERPRVLKKAANMRVGLDIYLLNPT